MYEVVGEVVGFLSQFDEGGVGRTTAVVKVEAMKGRKANHVFFRLCDVEPGRMGLITIVKGSTVARASWNEVVLGDTIRYETCDDEQEDLSEWS